MHVLKQTQIKRKEVVTKSHNPLCNIYKKLGYEPTQIQRKKIVTKTQVDFSKHELII